MANRTLYIFSWIALLAVCPFQIQNVTGLACGKVNLSRPLIQDGNPALRGEWPFIAALHKVRESKFFCGGTLITNQHVLTGNSDFVAPMLGSIGNKWKKKLSAAHCIQQKFSPKKLSPDNLTVRLGAHNITAKSELGMVERNVTAIHVHPQWDVYENEYDSDIAILVLNDKVMFTNFIQPVCMPGDVALDGVVGPIVGWGITNNGTIAVTPQYTVTKILNASYCYKKDPPIISFSSSNTFCGGEGDGTPNKGDSGGGMFAVSNSSWMQYGIISAVRTNETGHVMQDSFAVYTNIILFKSWIVDTAKMNDNMTITLRCHYGPFYFVAKYIVAEILLQNVKF